MTADCYPLRVLLMTFSGWVNRKQQRTIEYLVEENHRERPHQGLGNAVIERAPGRRPTPVTEVRCEERLGGLLRHYRSAA